MLFLICCPVHHSFSTFTVLHLANPPESLIRTHLLNPHLPPTLQTHTPPSNPDLAWEPGVLFKQSDHATVLFKPFYGFQSAFQ